MSAVTIDHTSKTYKRATVLDDVSFVLPEGRCLALIGHNGAGKTTLMKLILGLISPSAGRVEVLGEVPTQAGTDFRRKLGFLPENVSFHDELSGADTIAFYARLKSISAAQGQDLLDRVGLTAAAGRRVRTYSKGMRQRLGLAQALLGNPRLLLLDEPTTGLDPVLRQEFFRIIRELTDGGTTVILSSHILTELEARTDLAAILRDGQLVAYGDLEALRAQAGLPVVVRVKGNAKAISSKLNGAFPKTLHEAEQAIDINCQPASKMKLLKTLAGFGDLCTDVEIHPPSLDDLYLHYSGRSIAGPAETE